MAYIKIKRGLDIPIKGKPSGPIQPLIFNNELPFLISLNLRPFEDLRFKLLTKVGDSVKKGQPLAEDKISSGRMFCSPAGGIVKEIRRGNKRSLQDIVIETSKTEEIHEWPKLKSNASK